MMNRDSARMPGTHHIAADHSDDRLSQPCLEIVRLDDQCRTTLGRAKVGVGE